MLALVLAISLGGTGPSMAGPPVPARSGAGVPPPFATFLASNPSSECDTSATISGITFTNTSSSRYCTRMGDSRLVGVNANVPRVNNNGVLIETNRINPLIRNRELDNVAWTASNVTVVATNYEDPEGGSTAEGLGSSLGTPDGSEYIESTAFVPGQTSVTASYYGRVGNLSASMSVKLVVRDTTAGADRATCTSVMADAYARYSCNATGLTAANNHVLRVHPDALGEGDTSVVWGVQVEGAGASYVTSLIPTAGASVTRAVDVATYTNATDISAQGCVSATVTASDFSGPIQGSIISNGTEMMLGFGSATQIRSADGTNTVNAAVSNVVGRTFNVLAKWSGSTLTVVADGVTATGSFDGAFSSTATLRIGATAAGSGYCNCTIKNIKFGSHPESCG